MSPVFDVATRLILVKTKGPAELKRQEVVLSPNQPSALVRQLVDLGIKRLICGAISQEFQLLLEAAGIRVTAHVCGEVESVLAADRAGTMHQPEFVMPGCCRHRQGKKLHPCGCQQRRASHPSLLSPSLPKSKPTANPRPRQYQQTLTKHVYQPRASNENRHSS